MRAFKNVFKSGLALSAALFFVNSAKAADLSFDNSSGSMSLLETVRSVELPVVPLPRLSAAAAIPGAHVYNFSALYSSLGYPSPDFFGSSEQEVQDLETYTSKEDTFYKEINDYLRYYPKPYDWSGTSPAAAKIMVKNIDRVFSRVPALPADLVLFRGLSLKYHGNKPYETGEEFTDKGYASTSVSYKVARYFAVEMDSDGTAGDRKAIFAIYLGRPGVKGVLIDEQEDEVILKHGTRFRVMGKKDDVKKYDLYLVQACAASCETVLKKDAADFWAGFTVQD